MFIVYFLVSWPVIVYSLVSWPVEALAAAGRVSPRTPGLQQ